jgi:cellulose synthase/poly-beta-1,6-N-acetylglucosamine synthase-like glycosyltransferase
MRVLFWISAILIAYTFVGYHLLLRVIGCILPRQQGSSRLSPDSTALSISVVIPCYNEEKVIRRRIENLLALDYPPEKREIIIASDGSTDGTSAMAEEYGRSGVKVLKLARGGRALAHNAAVAAAGGDVIIFADADTEFDKGFVRAVVGHFLEDQRVGCVAACLRWKVDQTPLSRFTGLYWKHENDIRKLESRIGILTNAPGPAMAIRRNLWKPMADSLDDCDSISPLDAILAGYRVVFVEDAVAHEVPFSTAKSSFRAKVRGVSKTVIMISRRWGIRNLFEHPLYSWRMLSHHFLRWLVPYFLLASFLSSLWLLKEGGLYRGILVAELLAGLLVLTGYFASRFNRHVAIASHLFSFAIVNAGFALGVLKGLAGAARGEYETE